MRMTDHTHHAVTVLLYSELFLVEVGSFLFSCGSPSLDGMDYNTGS